MESPFNPSSLPEPSSSSHASFIQDAPTDVLTDHVAGLRIIEREGYELGVKRGRNTLYWIAAVIFVSEILIAYAKDLLTIELVIIALLEGLLFAGLGFYTHKKPYLAILLGLILFMAVWALSLAYSLSNLVSGLVVRLVLIVFLIRALPDAKKLEKMDKEAL
jgi:hypothetical protein